MAIVLPQSLQLSVYNHEALEAQQTAVRVLYNYDHAAAYAVGEYQIDTLGSPRLIILPSAYGLTDAAWSAIEARVRDGRGAAGSPGRLRDDPHLHPTSPRCRCWESATQPYRWNCGTRRFRWAGEPLTLTYGGMKTTTLSRAQLPAIGTGSSRPLGKGKILFSALPLELNDRLDAVAAVYDYALKSRWR